MTDNKLTELLKASAAQFEIDITREQNERFDCYRIMLKEWNEHINLTAITDDEGIIVKHFADSMSLAPLIKKYGGGDIADIGTGAGFPGIPLKIIFPEMKVSLVDSLAKRLNFLNELIDRLGLVGIETVHARAEDIGRNPDYRESFDMVTARAVASMPVLLEYCMPLVKNGGVFFAMKGQTREEGFGKALRELSSKLDKEVTFTLMCPEPAAVGGEAPVVSAAPCSALRRIYCIKKVGRTSTKYPRKAGTATKSPII